MLASIVKPKDPGGNDGVVAAETLTVEVVVAGAEGLMGRRRVG